MQPDQLMPREKSIPTVTLRKAKSVHKSLNYENITIYEIYKLTFGSNKLAKLFKLSV